jgi:outer membrane protein TolC
MKLVSVLLLLTSISAYAAPGDDLLSQQIVSQNLSILGQNQNVESEKVKRGYLGRSFLPSLIIEVGQERFQTGRYKTFSNPYGLLEARFNIFKGGRDSIESDIRELNARIAEYNRSVSVRDQINKVRKIQWQIIYNNELIRILEEEEKQNQKILAQAEKRARSGVSTRSDTLEFNIYRSELTEGLETLKHDNNILKIGLLPLINLSSVDELEFQDQLLHQHDDELLSKSFNANKHPVVASMNAENEGFQLQKRSNNLWWTPSVDFYGGYYLYTLRDRDYSAIDAREDRVVGARVTFLLFDGLKSYNQASASHYQAEAKRLQAKFLEKQTDAQYVMLKEDLRHTHEVMHFVEDRIKKSKIYLKETLDEYDRGVKNSLDALVAMQRYYRYEKQYLEKKKEYQIIKSDILALRGE